MYIATYNTAHFNRSIYNDEFKSKVYSQINTINKCDDDQASTSSSSPINVFSLSDDSSSLSSSSSSSSLSSVLSPVWTSALYSPCLHSNLFKTWSSNLMDFNDFDSDHSAHSFSLSSYSLDNEHSKKIGDFENNRIFNNEQNCLEDENGKFLISYQEMNNKINDLLNCKESKLLKSNKNKHLNVHTDTDMDNWQQIKPTSPKPKFIAPRFEKKWLENQFVEYNRIQTFNKQSDCKLNTNNINIINKYGKKMYPAAGSSCQTKTLNCCNRRNNLLNKTNKYLNQSKTLLNQQYQPKRFCKCLTKCTCSNYTMTVPTFNYTNNENEFYTNRSHIILNNINNNNGTNYKYVNQTQNYSNPNQQRYRYRTKSRA